LSPTRTDPRSLSLIKAFQGKKDTESQGCSFAIKKLSLGYVSRKFNAKDWLNKFFNIALDSNILLGLRLDYDLDYDSAYDRPCWNGCSGCLGVGNRATSSVDK
jgi:hypothetical protein